MVQLLVVFGLVAASLTECVEKPFTIEELTEQPIPEDAKRLTGHALVNYVNRHQQFYRAQYPLLSTEMRTLRIMDEKYLDIPNEVERVDSAESDEDLPESFDSRKNWPECTSISTIRDQSNCDSSWAVAAASTMSDRLCIQSQGRIKAIVSETELLSCCAACVSTHGCAGGFSPRAWAYAMEKGICTGGLYKTKGVCKPYAFHPCGKHSSQTYYGECPKEGWIAPLCTNLCQRGYPVSYEKDKFYAKSVYKLDGERTIRKEIMTNGPVQAGFTVYGDFDNYISGVYIHTAGEHKGGHSVKIIGWGNDNGTDYWLVSNSRSIDWGDNGYLRILRGKNHCGIENRVFAGMMKV